MSLHKVLHVLVLALAAAVVVAAYALSKLTRALTQVRGTNDALASRISELATIQATSRELLATLDPERITGIVERECRKIFEVDAFFLGLVDRRTHVLDTRDVPAALGIALPSRVLHEKRALCVGDADGGSILAAPLLVGELPVGVLSVQCRRPSAYDDHQLSVFATIAQQAAVAVENAHHYASATVDALTGLMLRESLLRRFEEEYLRAQRYTGTFSIVMIDLDDFKDLNERQGHPLGDRYLRELGAAIKGRMRGADIGGRYGGDEFCLLLPETGPDGAGLLAERLRQVVARLVVDADGTPVRTTASIGIASFPAHDAGGIKALLLRADQAVYKAKRAGRNRVVSFTA